MRPRHSFVPALACTFTLSVTSEASSWGKGLARHGQVELFKAYCEPYVWCSVPAFSLFFAILAVFAYANYKSTKSRILRILDLIAMTIAAFFALLFVASIF